MGHGQELIIEALRKRPLPEAHECLSLRQRYEEDGAERVEWEFFWPKAETGEALNDSFMGTGATPMLAYADLLVKIEEAETDWREDHADDSRYEHAEGRRDE